MPRTPVEDEEISKELEKQFKKQGITVYTGSEVTSADTSGSGVKAKVKTANGEITLEADIILSAAGIVANIENIGLEQLGIKTEKGKITVNKHQQTNVPGIYAIGDCSPGQPAHVTKEVAKQSTSVTMKRNIPTCLNRWITTISPAVPIVHRNSLTGYTEKRQKMVMSLR